jgi:hypothetical protein
MENGTNSCALRVLLRLDLERRLAASILLLDKRFKSQKVNLPGTFAGNDKKPSASRRGNVVSSLHPGAKSLFLFREQRLGVLKDPLDVIA